MLTFLTYLSWCTLKWWLHSLYPDSRRKAWKDKPNAWFLKNKVYLPLFKALCETALSSVTQSSYPRLWEHLLFLDGATESVVMLQLNCIQRRAGVPLVSVCFFEPAMCTVHDISNEKEKINQKNQQLSNQTFICVTCLFTVKHLWASSCGFIAHPGLKRAIEANKFSSGLNSTSWVFFSYCFIC